MFVQSEFLHFLDLTDEEIFLLFKGRSVKKALEFLKGMRKALTGYSKGKQEIDEIQLRAINIFGQIEKWCKHRFYRDMTSEYMRRFPDLVTDEKAIKRMVRTEWETLLNAKGMY